LGLTKLSKNKERSLASAIDPFITGEASNFFSQRLNTETGNILPDSPSFVKLLQTTFVLGSNGHVVLDTPGGEVKRTTDLMHIESERGQK
jgi:hypothetical protein